MQQNVKSTHYHIFLKVTNANNDTKNIYSIVCLLPRGHYQYKC